MANETREFLTELYNQAAKDDETPQETAERVSQNLRGVSRRELIGGAGAVGMGSLLGFGGSEMVGTASAEANTSDSDGNFGTPSNPADAFVDGVDVFDGANNQIGSLDETGLAIPSVSTSDLSISGQAAIMAQDGMVVPVGPGLSTSDAIDPNNTATPVQDAVDEASTAGKGAVLLPPGSVSESSSVNPKTVVSIFGFGEQISKIDFTSSGSNTDHGIHFDQQRSHITLSGFTIGGPGSGKTTGYGIYFETGNSFHINIPSIKLNNWGNDAFRSDGSPFKVKVGLMDATNIAGSIVKWPGGGSGNSFGYIYGSPTDGSTVIDLDGPNLNFGHIVIGGACKRAVTALSGTECRIGRLHYEPNSQPSVPKRLVFDDGAGNLRIDSLQMNRGTSDWIYALGSGYGRLAKPVRKGASTINDGIAEIRGGADPNYIYEGPSADVTDNSGNSASSGAVACLSDNVCVPPQPLVTASPGTGLSQVGSFGQGTLKATEELTLADDATETVQLSANNGRPFLILIRNSSDNEGAIFASHGNGTTTLHANGSWATSDADGSACVFLSGGDVIFKNRLGGSRDFRIICLGVT